MSVLVAKATGNLSDATATWAVCDATSLLFNLLGTHSRTTLTTSYVASQTFVPGAITIDGIGVKINDTPPSPSGTMSVELFNSTDAASVAGTEVTINVSDLPNVVVDLREAGWVFFKFAAPVLLVAGKAYSVRAKTSASSQVALWRNATAANWLRFLRTTTEQAPIAGDDLVIARQWTAAATHTADCVITMDSTAATDFGSGTGSTNTNDCGLFIGDGQEFKFANAASTNYIFRMSGNVIVGKGGTLSVGKTGAAIPRSGSAEFILDPSADGIFRFEICTGATFNALGESRTSGKNFTWTTITADTAGGATTIPVADDTGWLSGDNIVYAGSNVTYNQQANRVLNGDAGPTSMVTTVSMTSARDADQPIKAEVILLTRNVRFKSQTAGNTFPIQCWDCAIDVKWASFQHLGSSSPRGIDFNNTSATTSQKTFQYCSFYDFDLQGIYWNNTSFNLDNLLIDNCVFYPIATDAVYLSGALSFFPSDFIVTNNVTIGNGNTASTGFTLACKPTQFEGNRSTCHGYGFDLSGSNMTCTMNANIAHSNYRTGCHHTSFNTGLRLTNWKLGRNGEIGSSIGSNVHIDDNVIDVRYTGCDAYGAVTAGVILGSTYIVDLIFDTCNVENETGFTSLSAINVIDASTVIMDGVKFINCNMDGSSGITGRVAHALIVNASNGTTSTCFGKVTFERTKTGTPTTGFLAANMLAKFGSNLEFLVTNDNNPQAAHRTIKKAGEIRNNTSVFQTAAPSAELRPVLATTKLEGGVVRCAVDSGNLVAFSAAVRKDGSYTGNAPRLVLRRNDALGITVDTVLDTLTVGANTWETLGANTPTVSADGVLEAFVDCDGTAGSVFVDDVAAA